MGFLFDKRKQQVKIPFEFVNNFIVIELSFNKVLPLKFIFDTGAENTLFTKREFIEVFGLKLGRKFTVIGSDLQSTLNAYLVQNISLSTEFAEAPHQDVLVLEEDYIDFEKHIGMIIHGIAGADLFKRYVVKIDYQKQELVLFRKLPKFSSTYDKVNLSIEKSKLYTYAPLSVNGQGSLDAKLLIDTGADLGLLVNTKSDSTLNLPIDRLPSKLGQGLGGFVEGYIGRVRSIQLGPYELQNIIGNFQDDVYSKSDSLNILSRNGIIGNHILERFTLLIDYVKEDLYIKPRKKWQREFDYDRSGLVFILAGARRKDYLVQHVIQGSPADDQGLLRGDKLLRINGIPHALFSFHLIGRILSKKEGKKVNIMVLRKGEKLKKTIQLRDII